ncbi:hypothetical protein QN360_03760 [Glaciimonas sp. CA11.2]|nr:MULTISPECIES: hypothetical protein [unclassified Glaciimonas]MDY7546078.1 hypothetical protein [Glaciimonas sp. CA11.2]MEB0012072.1 hypothetical protein [Glaciimonas sp. Cout2]MEB0084267.1 hypothetical protein [Glaciimonas sp. Gout2]MEB0162022.1 hypothetical protein [Glaciimonas sp. CA11.2]
MPTIAMMGSEDRNNDMGAAGMEDFPLQVSALMASNAATLVQQL